MDITFITPRTEEELAAVKEDVMLLNSYMPTPVSIEVLMQNAVRHLGWKTLIYAGRHLIGGFWIEPFKKSAQLHGVFRDGVPGRVKVEVQRIVLDRIFERLKKDKVIIKASPDNKGVRGFALLWGFQRVDNVDKGQWIWRLPKEKFYERLKRLRLNEQIHETT